MIKYSLICDEAHVFESWFRSSVDYEEQARRGFVECPACRSTKVTKAVMAPSLARRDRDRPARAGGAPEGAPVEATSRAQNLALFDENSRDLRAAMRELRDKIIAASTDVGDQFADQARRMHEGEIPMRAIRGQASVDEARSLWESGVPVMPIPTLPEEQN